MGKGDWIEHDGKGRPVPLGTLCDLRLMNGEVAERVRIGPTSFTNDGTIIPASKFQWSGWRYDDGGPMAPKIKAYRLCKDEERERSVAKFRHLLTPSERETAHD